MALSGLDIYKLLPKTNCRECGFPTCLAFAMQLAKKAVPLSKCPHLTQGVKATLEEASLPAIRQVSIGKDKTLDIGNETVMFRHEDKFYHPTAIGFIIDDNLSKDEINDRLSRISRMRFERVGETLEVNLIAIRQNSGKAKFLEAVKLVCAKTDLGIVLMSKDLIAQKEALEIFADKKPLIYSLGKENVLAFAELAFQYKVPLVAVGSQLQDLSVLTREIKKKGLEDIVLDTGEKRLPEKIWDFTQIRRLALKKKDRSFGYPVLAVTAKQDPYEEAAEAAAYICKYASIVLLSQLEAWQLLSLLTLRQNIYTDPQKPLQIEPKVYPIGPVTRDSPVLVTTNFSLTYFTVLGEVEASKVPSYIASIDTEGMSVLTAWAAEKFTPDKISQSLNNWGVSNLVAHKKLIIPGYVAVMSGDLEEQSKWNVVVGPKEASGIPSFLKNLKM